MIILSHPTGNANLRAIAESLYRSESLEAFYTSIATFPGNFWDKAGKLPGMGDFGRRAYPSHLQALTHQYPPVELGRMFAGKAGLPALTAHEKGVFSVDKVYQALDTRVARHLDDHPTVRGVYAYEDGALATFTAAKERGLRCYYDLPIAYWDTKGRLVSEEAERYPAWSPTMGGGTGDSDEKLERKTRELELADAVIGPGSFVMDSLPDWAADKHRIVAPFGSPLVPAVSGPVPAKPTDRPLRVLFAGSLTQRKGLADLFAAMKLLDTSAVELVVLGGLRQPLEFYRSQYAGFTYERTRPHSEVLKLMGSCDVFCLPSIVEGRALVMQEAMSQGLPIIITPNTGGADLVIPDETGFLVPIRSPEAIAKSIEWFVQNRTEIPRMGEAARRHAARYTWEAYGNAVVRGLQQHLQLNPVD
ncbi:glycosyltransferase involved in cell wall biosynthesis [Lewinella aquimaris]|uniref:Glycosyltransferase involved in cell wall biosynthesis n=1 Tax=Neolewinella aquimaris TaxID=1835722 RepID=A0A840E0J1_9BACT|nr:glycosyltransferase [Neolewinella aquimaris]MBB4079024.1 glycosyltransferase involved in cell wall biosynthesis [Neolewinella aquimaris]